MAPPPNEWPIPTTGFDTFKYLMVCKMSLETSGQHAARRHRSQWTASYQLGITCGPLTLLRQHFTVQDCAIAMIHRINSDDPFDHVSSGLLLTKQILYDQLPQIFVERGAMREDQREACFCSLAF